MFAMLQGNKGFHVGALALHAFHQQVMVPIVKQNVHVRPVQAVGKSLQVHLDVQGDAYIAVSHGTQQYG